MLQASRRGTRRLICPFWSSAAWHGQTISRRLVDAYLVGGRTLAPGDVALGEGRSELPPDLTYEPVINPCAEIESTISATGSPPERSSILDILRARPASIRSRTSARSMFGKVWYASVLGEHHRGGGLQLERLWFSNSSKILRNIARPRAKGAAVQRVGSARRPTGTYESAAKLAF